MGCLGVLLSDGPASRAKTVRRLLRKRGRRAALLFLFVCFLMAFAVGEALAFHPYPSLMLTSSAPASIPGHIYVSNNDGNTVSVINGATKAVTATVSVGSAPYSIAVNASTNTVYVVNESGNTVSVINGATNAVTATVSVGSVPEPVGVAVNASTNTVYVTDFGYEGYNGAVSVINGGTNAVTATITVGASPGAVAVNASTNTVYVTNSGDNTVSVINGATNAVTATITVGSEPEGIVYIRKNGIFMPKEIQKQFIVASDLIFRALIEWETQMRWRGGNAQLSAQEAFGKNLPPIMDKLEAELRARLSNLSKKTAVEEHTN